MHRGVLPLYFHLEYGLVIALARSLISSSGVELGKGYLFGAGGLILFILAVAAFRYLLNCLSRAFEASCDRLERRLAGRKMRRHPPSHRRRSAPKLPTSVAKQQPRPAAVKSVSRKQAAVQPYKARRPVDARDALRRSCAATNHPSKSNAP
jgi:Zn-dependent protease with chaperone function